MATNYDVLFLRLMVQNGLTERNAALRCLQAIDGAARQGRSLNAAQAALELGLTDRDRAEQIHGLVSRQFEQSGEMLRALDARQAEMEVSAEQQPLKNTDTQANHFFDLSQTGEGLDGYQLGPLLGHGISGSSFRGRRSDGAPVVVKTLHPRFSDHPEFLAQVKHELKCWLGFRHPNAAATLALGTSHGHAVVVFEHAPGQSLDEYLKAHGPLPVEAAVGILIDVCGALEAAHEKGLYDGDIRSRKIFYDGRTARLTDLGMSRASCLAGGFGGFGIPFGHPVALAPEVLQEGQTRPQAASDVYALGILFYELLCGRPPFHGDVPQLLEQHLESPLPPPPDEVTFSTAVAGVILRMTAKAADQRVQDVGHLREALEQLQAGRPFRLQVGKVQAPVEMISAHDWDEASQRQMARESRMWSATAIRKAPLVGPSDIGPTQSTIGGIPMGQVSGRLPPELVEQLRADASSSSVAPSRFEAKIGEKLGRGTVGTTYDGRVPGLEAKGPVVIKVVSRKYAKHQEIMDMILGELRKAKGFQHPNVVPILEVVSAGGRDLVVMPKVAGKTLRAVLDERGRLPMLDAVGVVADVARALDAAEERGLSHGDIRPEKIYIDPSGSARLADFGHAKAACLGAGLGKHGLYFGDPGYLAPEVLQERQQQPGPKGDIYALGIVFYEMLCGRRPFDGAEPKETLLNHLKQPLPPPPREVVMPQAVANTIMRMTAKDPTKRYDSITELEAGLQECRDVAAASGEHAAISAASSGMMGSGSNIVEAIGSGAVEEFDPLASSTAGDVKSAWAARSQVTMKAEEGWSKEKIKKAQKVGPRSWDGPVAKDKNSLGALYDEMKKASGAHTATKGKGKGKKSQRAKGEKPAKKGKRGKKEEVDTKQLFITGGALVGVVAVIVALIVLNPFGEEKPIVKKTEVTTHVGGGPTLPPPPDPDKLKEEAAKVDAALSEYTERVQSKLHSGHYKDALTIKEELIKPEWASIPRVKKAVDELESKVSAACNAKLQKERKIIQRLLDGDQLQRALARVRQVKTWVLRESDYAQLHDLVVGRQRQEAEELTRLSKLFGDPRFVKGPVEASLRKQLKGWSVGGDLTSSGGLILDYDGPTFLIKDLKRLQGGKGTKITAAPAGGNGIHIVAGKRATVVALDLELRFLLEASVRFVLKTAAKGDGELGLVAGVPDRMTGVGVKWGLVPAILRSNGGLRAVRGADPVRVPGGQVMVMTLRVAPDRRRKTSSLLVGSLTEASTLKVKSGGQNKVLSKKLAGKVAIVARNVEVWIQGLKVKGLVGKN